MVSGRNLWRKSKPTRSYDVKEGRKEGTTFPISLLISPMTLSPMDTLSLFSSTRFTAPYYPPYPEPTPFVPWSQSIILVFTLWGITSKRVNISSYPTPPLHPMPPLNHLLPSSQTLSKSWPPFPSLAPAHSREPVVKSVPYNPTGCPSLTLSPTSPHPCHLLHWQLHLPPHLPPV